MVEILTIDSCTSLRTPRRIMKNVLIYCSKGNLNLIIDERKFELGDSELITITSGQVHHISGCSEAKGLVLEFTFDFFCKDHNDIELIFHNGLFCHFAMNEVIAVDANFVSTQLKFIQQELIEQPYQYLISVHSRIKLILVSINRSKVDRGHEIWKPDALFLKFLEAVRNNFEKNYSLSQYAQLLNSTEVKLNEMARMHAGKTAQNVMHGLIVSEAKRLLTYGDLTIKEVAYKLGFNDPFYFSNFFKKQTKLSPKLYKEKFSI